jgi:hypothetical protein
VRRLVAAFYPRLAEGEAGPAGDFTPASRLPESGDESPQSKVGVRVTLAELDEGGAAEMNDVDTHQTFTFDKGSMGDFCRHLSQAGANPIVAGQGCRIALSIADGAEVADQEWQFRSREIRPQPGDQGGQFSRV